MIIWDEIKYSSEKARQDFDKLTIDKLKNIEVSDKYLTLRNSLISARDEVFDANGFDTSDKLGYNFDLTFGIEMYDILNNHFDFKFRDASNDDIWRFLQIQIIPDVVFSRWELNEERFYKTNRRIWLKTLWWYVHLSWNEDKTLTHEILKNNTTDTIMNLVERPGLGYDIALFREIMKKYSQFVDGSNDSRLLFRRVLIMNTARSVTLSPELFKGGIETYVANIFRDVENSRR
ncbi:hypothetical protein PH235_01115 [Trichococcus sp. K1Tr]|uniref:hypothetical protein n=1 Tax=Trichococcus sp. K1Tr TaxID=3020847 RepID=UPI00232B0692|nr:hypothetical protein [Trichococcus sp. K1Tr]MDB6352155.1 hypothetical protein [Trichococcus sp. K1Tr]